MIFILKYIQYIYICNRVQPVEIRQNKILETTLPLLSICKSELDRASDFEGYIDKFVFCVPCAEATAITLDCGNFDPSGPPKKIEGMLLEPLEELLTGTLPQIVEMAKIGKI